MNDSNGGSNHKTSEVQEPIDLELTSIAKNKMDKPLVHEDEVDTAGEDGRRTSNSSLQMDGREQTQSTNYNEETDGDNIIMADHADVHNQEHMVSRQEDSWTKTLAGVAGNILEWYDFAVFGYFSDVLGDVFFPPNQDGHAAIIESFAVFGGGEFVCFLWYTTF